MVKALKFKKLQFKRPFKQIRSNFKRDIDNLPRMEAAFTKRRARSIMRKAPKKPKSRFGRIQPYRKRQKNGRSFYWKKGLYSRPGHPPFHHGGEFNLRTIDVDHIPNSATKIVHARTDATSRTVAYRVGPRYTPSRFSKPIPELHEFGGTVKINKRSSRFEDRGIKLRRMPITNRAKHGMVGGTGQLTYKPRPYMAPSSKEARSSAAAKHGGSIPWLTKLGGYKGRRKY